MGTLTLKAFLDAEFGESVDNQVTPSKLSIDDINTPENLVVGRHIFPGKSEKEILAIIRRKICDFFERIEEAKISGCEDGTSISIITKCNAAFVVIITPFHNEVRVRVTRSC